MVSPAILSSLVSFLFGSIVVNGQFVPDFDGTIAVALGLSNTHPLATFNPLQHAGPASSYFVAPSQAGIPYDTPDGCVVDQAAYIVRHASRYPEPGSYKGWQDLFAKFQNTTYTARGPLSFIPSWVPAIDDLSHQPLFLTGTGAGEAFQLGVTLRQKYGLTKGGENFTVWSANQQRVVDTATYFVRGYLSQGNYLNSTSQNRGIVITLPDSPKNTTFADSLTPSASCPAYAPPAQFGTTNSNLFRTTFQNRTAARLNTFLDGLVLNATDVGVMQDLCGFGWEVNGEKRFCELFEPDEWMDYEYAHDLNYYYGSGPGNPLSATTGWPYVKAISDLFAAGPGKTTPNGTLTPPPLIMGFTHDNNLPPIISALGVWNSTTTFSGAHEAVYPLPTSNRMTDPARYFHASYLVNFLGNIALERITCTVGGPTRQQERHQGMYHQANIMGGKWNSTRTMNATSQTFVRLRANDAPIPIPSCDSGPGSTCPLDQFVKYVNGPRKEVSGDFVEACGLKDVQGATSELSVFTKKGDGVSMVIGLEGTPTGPAVV